MMKRLFSALLIALIANFLSAPLPASGSSGEIRVGSKKFTESVILGEILTVLLKREGVKTVYRRELGGTRVLWDALLKGEIDVYPEYTGTISREIFAGEGISGEEAIMRALQKKGMLMTRSLGFNDTYVIGMRQETCRRLNIHKISDLGRYPSLRFGFSNEFMARADGWRGLQHRYGLPQKHVRGMDHDLSYRGIESGSIDATDLYSTDAEIRYYGLCLLEDDRHFFPVYDSVFLYRADSASRIPRLVSALKSIEGRISQVEMIKMNEEVKIGKIPENRVAAQFLEENLSIPTGVMPGETASRRIWRYTLEHLYLVAISLLGAVIISVPLGILAAKRPKIGQFILSVTGVIQTIPSLALLVFMIPLMGIGAPPAIVALFLYSLLPIVRNTYLGIREIPADVSESAEALGLPGRARLLAIELPMASPSVLAGIKTSAVINVGTATLGALIGAGGYGEPILTGIRLDDLNLILQGAVPAALLALLVQGVFDVAERIIVPKGLRLKKTE